MMLGGLGARVIKIEVPGRGDDTRGWGPPFLAPDLDRTGYAPSPAGAAAADAEPTFFHSAKRNTSWITLDLKDADDHRFLVDAILHKRAERAPEMARQQGIRAADLMADGIVHAKVPEEPPAHDDPVGFSRRIPAECSRQSVHQS